MALSSVSTLSAYDPARHWLRAAGSGSEVPHTLEPDGSRLPSPTPTADPEGAAGERINSVGGTYGYQPYSQATR